MKKFKENTVDIHRLIVLTAKLNFQLREAEETRKEITKLSLKAKRNRKIK